MADYRAYDKALKAAGFRIENTGGGCTCYQIDTVGGGFVMITDPEDPSHSFPDGNHIAVGIYDNEQQCVVMCDDAKMFVEPDRTVDEHMMDAIYRKTIEALQNADEIGGVEDPKNYVTLMENVIREATRRLDTCKANMLKNEELTVDEAGTLITLLNVGQEGVTPAYSGLNWQICALPETDDRLVEMGLVTRDNENADCIALTPKGIERAYQLTAKASS